MTRASAKTMPRSVERRAQRLERVDGGEVDLDVGLGVEQEPLDRLGVAPGRRRARARWLEVLGVGEEQRRVVAVDDEAGHLLALGVVVDVVHAGEPGHVAEDAVVRPGDAAQQVEHRQRRWRPGCRGARRRRSTPAVVARASTSSLRRNRGDPAQLRDVDEPDGGVDDDGAERRASGTPRGPGRANSRAATTRHEDDERVQLGAAADRVADGGAAAAAADREALQEPGADVGGAEREELLVRVDRLAVPRPRRRGR